MNLVSDSSEGKSKKVLFLKRSIIFIVKGDSDH